MAIKKTGISPDLIIHPGETIADVLVERDITQAELATLVGVTSAYISQIIKGKRDISTRFAVALEYALKIPKSFWINLQANYDAEKLEYEKKHTVTEGEIQIIRQLKDVIKYLRSTGKMQLGGKKEEIVIYARESLQISNLALLKDLIAVGSFRMAADAKIDPFVMGAWLRICQLQENRRKINTHFEKEKIAELISDIKKIMCGMQGDFRKPLIELMARHGIDFSLVKNFRGAPVQGYITQKKDGSYQMVLTIRGAFADIFWFSLFHELGHIYLGHVGTNIKFIDYNRTSEQEFEANAFASNALISVEEYEKFLGRGDFRLQSIREFAEKQFVMPYIVIGRLQKQGKLHYSEYSQEKLRYKWTR
jgi:hypothetical protein